jgi:hypothetical protein
MSIDQFGVHVHLEGQSIKDCFVCNKQMTGHLVDDHEQNLDDVLLMTVTGRYKTHLRLHPATRS